MYFLSATQDVDQDKSGGIDEVEMRKLFKRLNITLPDPGMQACTQVFVCVHTNIFVRMQNNISIT